MLSHLQLLATPGMQPVKAPCPWNFLGKNNGVDCHLLLQQSSRPRDQAASVASSELASRIIATMQRLKKMVLKNVVVVQ